MAQRTPRGEQRQKILAAALEVFGEQGFAVARMDDIAARARVSKGTLYNVFENKDELFLELCISALRSYGDLLCENLEQNRPVEEALRLTIEKTMATLPTQEPFFYLFFDLWAKIGRDGKFRNRCFRAFQQCYCSYQQHLAGLVRRAQSEGLFLGVDPESFATLMVATFDGIVYQWTFNRKNLDLTLLAKTLMQVAVAAARISPSEARAKEKRVR